MKESKFIELLNLYVDHQISTEEAALLESEVRSNPERLRVYRQYCKMQKACGQLGEAFRTEAPAPAATSEIVEFKPRREGVGFLGYATAFGAAAACAVAMFVLRHPGDAKISAASTPAAQVAAVTPSSAGRQVIAQTVAARPALQPAFGPRSLKLRESSSEFADASATADQEAALDWMNNVRLSSLSSGSIEDFRFDNHTTMPGQNPAKRPFQGKVEMAAVRFQK